MLCQFFPSRTWNHLVIIRTWFWGCCVPIILHLSPTALQFHTHYWWKSLEGGTCQIYKKSFWKCQIVYCIAVFTLTMSWRWRTESWCLAADRFVSRCTRKWTHVFIKHQRSNKPGRAIPYMPYCAVALGQHCDTHFHSKDHQTMWCPHEVNKDVFTLYDIKPVNVAGT